MERPNKDQYYLNIAGQVLTRGTCLRRNYGAIIVNRDEIVGTGYTGSPRGAGNCCDLGYCEREKQKCKPGERYELCKSVHAEMNAIISAGRKQCIDATIYVVGEERRTGNRIATMPCLLCQRVIANAGITRVVINQGGTKDANRVHPSSKCRDI